jgi:hypothetical protein
MAMDRAQHLAWCKQRALELADAGECDQAFASMVSDLGKHPDTEGHAGIMLGMMLKVGGHMSDAGEVRRFIEGFN